jgi:two-component system, OmpR family, sensor kinase
VDARLRPGLTPLPRPDAAAAGPRSPPADASCEGEAAAREIEALRAALRAREEFLSVAAHELRNPLTPIRMQVAMLLRAAASADPPVPEGILRGLERLEVATRRFLKRATVLLDVSRLASGQPFRPELSRFDLSTAVLEALADHEPVAMRVRSPIDTSAVEPGLDGIWDRLGVELVLDNLVTNALKHGAGAPVQVGLARHGEAGVRLWVRDHGPGVAPEDRERIFLRFQQALARRADSGGFGVGLWVAREVARAMGGDVGVEGPLGSGATFYLFLPLDVAAYLAAADGGDAT